MQKVKNCVHNYKTKFLKGECNNIHYIIVGIISAAVALTATAIILGKYIKRKNNKIAIAAENTNEGIYED